MNVLVLNLTRLGDLLQSQPTITGLAAQGHRVGLVCLDNFAPAAALMRDVSEVFPLPGARLLARLDANWHSALGVHRELVEAVRTQFAPDAVINLTPSEPARLLAMNFQAPQTLGFALDEFGFNADTSLWAAFLQLAATSRGSSPFNVVDLFRRIETEGGQVADVELDDLVAVLFHLLGLFQHGAADVVADVVELGGFLDGSHFVFLRGCRRGRTKINSVLSGGRLT